MPTLTRDNLERVDHKAARLEHELLLACAHTSLDPHQRERLRLLFRGPVDWDYLLHVASLHAVLPLVGWNIKALAADLVPPACVVRIQDFLLENTGHNLYLTRELVRLLRIFEEHQIGLIPFKGPALATAVYGNLALRQFGDLDVLVHKRDVLKAKALLLAHGYTEIVALTAQQEKAHLRDDYVYNLVGDNGKVVLELHWAICATCVPFPLDVDRLRAGLQSITVAGTTLPNIAPEDLLSILCVHGTKHLWCRLGWICDVAELLRSCPQLDWERVQQQACALHSRRSVHLGLLLAREVLNAPLPITVAESIQQDREVVALAQKVQARLFREDDGQVMVDNLFLLRSMERLPDRIRYALHLVSTPDAEQRARLHLPDHLSFLWYLIRPVSLIGKYALAPLARFRR